jgi:PAS domain S-box-containing protein
MKEKCHILILEDNPSDVELIIRELKKDGIPCTFTQVETRDDFTREMEERRPTLILSDYKLPSFDGMSALNIVNKSYGEIPFIFVSGTLGEENAIEALKYGATDYVLKERLSKLSPAVVRALRDCEERAARLKLEQEMRDLQEKYRLINENVIDTIWLMDMDFNTTFISPSVTRLRGYTLEELRHMPMEKSLTPESFKTALAVMVSELTPDKLNDKNYHLSKTLELEFYKKDGSTFWAESTITLLRGPDGAPQGFLGVGRDITERKRVETALRESEEIFRQFMEHSPIYVFFKDAQIRSIRLSKNYETMLGKPIGELLGKTMDELYPSDLAKSMIADDLRILKEGSPVEIEEELNGRNYTTIKFPILQDGEPRYLAGFTIDITERKKAEDQLLASLAEKEALLREIHHRVKNNLQVISSLVGLQSHELQEGPFMEAMHDIQNRIKSMAIIHERLYRSEDMAHVDIREYIAGISSSLFQTFGIEPGRINMIVDVEDIRMGIGSAVPCGLIINELLTNALKHAFPGGRKGEIVVRMKRDISGVITLSVMDDGAGLPRETDIEASQTLGLRLVRILIKQLEGSISVRSRKGTEFIVRFHE